MRPLRPLLGVLLLATPLGVLAQGGGMDGPGPPPDSLAAAIERQLEPWDREDAPGATVVVVQDGEVLHMAAVGMANLEHDAPNDPGTVFDVASVAKPFAAFALALLEDEGALSLDDDVREHVPELPEFGRTITIGHLLHHTSGLRDWPATLAIGGWDLEDVLSYDQILRMTINQSELNFPPGEGFAYSNTGYNLLAEVVARVSGQSFRSFTSERIFEPLGMERTHFRDDHSEIVPERADSYGVGPDGEYHRIPSNLTAQGSSSLLTTAEDLARWFQHLDDPVVGDAELVERLRTPGELRDGRVVPYAWGLQTGSLHGFRTVRHGGLWAGYRSELLRVPEARFGVAVLANTADLNASALADRIARFYLEDRGAEVAGADAPDPAPEPAPLSDGAPTQDVDVTWNPTPDDLAEYEGTYRSDELHTVYQVELRGDVLAAVHFRRGAWALHPAGTDRFRSGAFGELDFTRNDAGEVDGFIVNQPRIRDLRFERTEPD